MIGQSGMLAKGLFPLCICSYSNPDFHLNFLFYHLWKDKIHESTKTLRTKDMRVLRPYVHIIISPNTKKGGSMKCERKKRIVDKSLF